MFPHGSEVGHILGQQKSPLHRIGHVVCLAPLEISYWGITYQRSAIQHQGWGLGRWFYLLVTLPLPLVGWPCLYASGLFGPPLGLILLGGMDSSCFYHLLTFLIPLPLVVGGISLDEWRGWSGAKPVLGGLPPRLGLQQLLESWSLLALNPHLFRHYDVFLRAVYLNWRRMARITDLKLWR